MAKTTQVILITGFLGAGKTTFLNRLIKAFPDDKRLTILINEFGEVNVDSQIVEGDDLDMWEVSRGSIFCVCVKSDFIKGLAKIASSGHTDLLVIEATGVANPAELKRDLQLPIFKGRFEFKEQICLLDAANFFDAYETFSAVEKQIKSSTLFILNKTDLSEPGQIKAVKDLVRKHHASPVFIEARHADIPMQRFLNDLNAQASGGDAGSPPPSEAEVNQLIRQLEGFASLDSLPPDELASRVFYFTGKSRDELKQTLSDIPKDIIRAKGIICLDGQPHLASRVMQQLDISRLDEADIPEKMCNLLVLIGKPAAIASLAGANPAGALRPCEW